MRSDPNRDLLAEALAETYVASEEALVWERILADLHPKQRAFVEDKASRKCAEKGRRAGGSYGIAAWLLEDWQLWAGQLALFVAITKETCANIIWPTLHLFDAKYQLGIKFDNQDLRATLPNGYQILLCGAKDRAQIEKLRGFAQGIRRVAIDETGSFSPYDSMLRYMVQSILSPQLMDSFHRGGGQLVLCGSPGIDPRGLFFERTQGVTHEGKPAQKWSTHHWTCLDNPHLDAAAYLLEELVEGEHIIDDTPPEELVAQMIALRDVPLTDTRWAPVLARLSNAFRREYLADWVRDEASLIYLPSQKNMLPEGFELPKHIPWRITIGCDRGWGDGNGFAVAAKSLRSRDIVLLRAYYKPSMSSEEIAAELDMLKKEWRSGEAYVDTGGEGDQVIVDMEHYGVLAEKAKKGLKKPRIEYLRALIQSGAFKIRPDFCADVLAEWSALPWDEERLKHREGYVDDVSDAVLMACWPLSQRFIPGKRPRPAPGTAEARKMAEDEEFERSQRKGKRIVRRIRPGRRVAWRQAA